MKQTQQKSRRPNGRDRYWSEKGVQPLKFEYEFRINPEYREEIQKLNQEKHPSLTPRQQKYLQEVIK